MVPASPTALLWPRASHLLATTTVGVLTLARIHRASASSSEPRPMLHHDDRHVSRAEGNTGTSGYWITSGMTPDNLHGLYMESTGSAGSAPTTT